MKDGRNCAAIGQAPTKGSVTHLLALGRRVLASQPFSVLVGAELLSFGEGHAQIEVPVRDELRQQHGIVRGGVVSYAADNAIAFAAGSVLGEGS